METRSVQTAFRFRPEMLMRMKKKARNQGVSLNAYVENLVQKDLDEKEDKYEKLIKELKGIKLNPNALDDLNSRIKALNIHISQEEIDADERMAYILSK